MKSIKEEDCCNDDCNQGRQCPRREVYFDQIKYLEEVIELHKKRNRQYAFWSWVAIISALMTIAISFLHK
jgi:hypothetical protein